MEEPLLIFNCIRVLGLILRVVFVERTVVAIFSRGNPRLGLSGSTEGCIYIILTIRFQSDQTLGLSILLSKAPNKECPLMRALDRMDQFLLKTA